MPNCSIDTHTDSIKQDLLSGINPALEKAEAAHRLQIQKRDDRIAALEKAVNLFIAYDEWCGDDIGDHALAYRDAIIECCAVMGKSQ